MDCLRRKHHKKREPKKHHQQPLHVSPDHSQPSTLKTTVNSTLPKAGSSGLWVDTPGMYGLAPPHNYFYGRPPPLHHPHGYRLPGMDHGYNLPRALSENRIPQTVPMPSQRFYHSQPFSPVYELPPTRGMEIYDYPYPGANGGFRSKLLETRHTPDYYGHNSEFILRPRVERSKSDAEDKKPTRPQHRKEPSKDITITPAETDRRLASKENKNWHLIESNEKQLLKPYGATRGANESVHQSNVNNGFSSETTPAVGTVIPSKVHNSKDAPLERQPSARVPNPVGTAAAPSSVDISSSATDSMKILAKNKTDDQKTKPTINSVVVDNNANAMNENNREFNIKHYTYEGSIYAMPEKKVKNQDYDNPIISRMKEMVLERSRHSSLWNNEQDSDNARESTASRKDIHAAAPESDVTKLTKIPKTKVAESLTTVPDRNHTEHQASTFNKILDVLPDVLVPDEDGFKNPPIRPPSQLKTADRSVAAAETRIDPGKPSRPVTDRPKDRLSPKESVEAEGGSDDLNRAGKQLATSAFEFLDNYLDDDDGTESMIDSPPLSPGGLKATGQVY